MLCRQGVADPGHVKLDSVRNLAGSAMLTAPNAQWVARRSADALPSMVYWVQAWVQLSLKKNVKTLCSDTESMKLFLVWDQEVEGFLQQILGRQIHLSRILCFSNQCVALRSQLRVLLHFTDSPDNLCELVWSLEALP